MKTLLAVLVLVVFVGCGTKFEPTPKFSRGDVVEVAQTREQVTVVSNPWVWGGVFQYRCRVASPVTVVHKGLLSRDSEVSRYSKVVFREFELQEVSE